MAQVQFDPEQRNGNTGIWNNPPGPPTETSAQTQPAGASPMAPGASGPPPTSGDAYRNWLAQQYHTPANIANDYWAPDWKEVFASPSRWGASAPATPAAASPFDINAYGQGWVGSGGRTLQDWQNYVQSHPLGAGYSIGGSKGDKVFGPNGQGWDAVIASGMGGTGASWNPFGGPGGDGGGASNPPQSAYAAQFSDPSTQRMEEYANYLISTLMQPPFSGQEQEVLRTQALEPIERDRTAAHQRALNNIGARGFDPSSGIAQELLNDVDRGFDTSRAQAQNQLAYNTIGQSHANQQQVLSLLQLLYQLPRNAMNDVLAVMNGSPNYSSLINGYTQLGAMNNMNSAANGQWLGQLIAWLTGMH